MKRKVIKSAVDDITKLNKVDNLDKDKFLEYLGFTKDNDASPAMYSASIDNGFMVYNPSQDKFYIIGDVDDETATAAYIDLVYNAYSYPDFTRKYPDAFMDANGYSWEQFLQILLQLV